MKALQIILASTILISGGVAFAANEQAIAKPTAQMQAVLDALTSLNPKPIESLSPADARIQPTAADAVAALLSRRGRVPNDQGITKVMDMMISGGAGKIPARIYQPAGVAAGAALPVVLYFHGGGWVIADIDVYDGSARAIAQKSQAIVVSVEYRKGPENKFPAAHDDAFASYQWLLVNAASIGADPKRIAVVGESAGGNLAVNVGLMARDNGLPMPVYIAAIYPIAGVDMNTKSYNENATAKPLNKAMMAWFFANYLVTMDQAKDTRINLVAANLKNLPPTLVITDQIDPLQSEGQLLAQRMQAQGVRVTYKNYDGVTHEFFGMGDVLLQAQQAENLVSSNLRKAF